MFFKKLYSRFLYFFGNWPEKVSAFRQDLLCRSEKTAFHVSIEIFRGEFVGKKTFCHFWTMSKNFPLVKTVFYMSRGSFQWSFFWKNVYFCKNFVFWTNFFRFWSEDFQKDCQNWKVRFHKKTWKEISLLKKLRLCYSFSEMSQKLLVLWRNFFGSVVKTAFDVSIMSIWEVFWQKRYFLAFSDTEQFLFGIHLKIFGQGC